MIQEPSPAMQGDPQCFTNLRDKGLLVGARPRERLRGSGMGSLGEEKGGRKFEVVARKLGDLTTATGSFEEPRLDEIWLIYVFQGPLILLNCRGQRLHSDGPSAEFFDDREEDFSVHLIKPGCIHPKPQEGLLGDSLGNPSLRLHLGVVADAFDEPIDDAGSSPGTGGDFRRPFTVDRDPEQPG